MSRSLPLQAVALPIVLACGLMITGERTLAHDSWSQNGDATNCRACHGDFRANGYVSPVDDQDWGNLHNLHRQTMVSGDCDVCHGASTSPVLLNSSTGGDGMAAISCIGCHGREEDNIPSNPEFPNGYGAGLRQHHFNTGTTTCTDCHADADPANYTPVGETILPPYYANPGTGHPDIPTDPCNEDGSENFAGATIGQDNDGNDLYDSDDPNCSGVPVPNIADARALLIQNFPNPFNPNTVIRYQIADPGWVRLSVYTINGELVCRLVDRQHDKADTYAVHWNGIDRQGNAVASGLYIYRLETKTVTTSKQMILLR